MKHDQLSIYTVALGGARDKRGASQIKASNFPENEGKRRNRAVANETGKETEKNAKNSELSALKCSKAVKEPVKPSKKQKVSMKQSNETRGKMEKNAKKN